MEFIAKTEEKPRIDKLVEFANSLNDKEREAFEIAFENFVTGFKLAKTLMEKSKPVIN